MSNEILHSFQEYAPGWDTESILASVDEDETFDQLRLGLTGWVRSTGIDPRHVNFCTLHCTLVRQAVEASHAED